MIADVGSGKRLTWRCRALLSDSSDLNGLRLGAYLAVNSSYVSSSWPERSIEVVPKLWARAAARVTGDCIRDRVNWGALKKPVGRTARVATRKMDRDDILRR